MTVNQLKTLHINENEKNDDYDPCRTRYGLG